MRVFQVRARILTGYILSTYINLLLSRLFHNDHYCDTKLMYLGQPNNMYLPGHSVLKQRKEFKYPINEVNICEESSPQMTILVGVFSSISEKPLRDFIRRKWGAIAKWNPRLRLIFILGLPENKNIDVQSIHLESKTHHDIIQADFKDTYINLVHKSFAFFRWATSFCANAKYLLKIDSDMQIDLLRLLSELGQRNLTDNFHCGTIVKHVCPIRDKKSKWYVSMDIFTEGKYPTYCQGAAYLVSLRIAGKMASLPIPRKTFPVDDVFMTGILREMLGEGIDDSLLYFYHHYDKTDTLVQDGKFSKYIMTIHAHVPVKDYVINLFHYNL